MSLWDKYFAPGDVRRRQQEQERIRDEVQRAAQDEARLAAKLPQRPARIDAAHRARRQNALLYGGLAFTGLSLFVTRRATARKYAQTIPKTFTPSNGAPPKVEGPPSKVDGSLEGVQALWYATLNTWSIFMAGIGIFMKTFDVADVEDLREMVRRGVGDDVYGGDSAADHEIEGWVASVLARKDGQGNLREGIAERIFELEQKAKEERRNGR